VSRFEIRPTSYAEVNAKAKHLLAEHWDEVALNKNVMVLKPDEARYVALEATGLFFALAAWDDDQLVGYSGNFIGTHLHYSALRFAGNDVLFVAKDHRKSPLGLRLIRETEREAARRGARLVMWHSKQGTALANILPKLGYKVQEIVHSRALAAPNFQMRGHHPMTNVKENRMQNFKLIAGPLDIAASLAEIVAQPEMWSEITVRQTFEGSVHHDTEAIHLRVPAQLTDQAIFNGLEAADYTPTMTRLPATCALLKETLMGLGATELGRVMIVKLKAGGTIRRHTDAGDYAAYYDRFHIPLCSLPGNLFSCGDEEIHMQPGEMWQISHHRIEHGVRNLSNEDRIHIIIDARLSDKGN
jgi:GNAT superfamily N-acetyltransferase